MTGLSGRETHSLPDKKLFGAGAWKEDDSLGKKISIGAAIAFIAIAIAATFSITMLVANHRFQSQVGDFQAQQAMYDKLAEVDNYVREHALYQPGDDVVNDGIIEGYLASLGDPYARYYSAQAKEELDQANNSVGSGIGITVVQDEGVRIFRVLPDSPAEQVGLVAGDVIVGVGDMTYAQNGYDGLLDALSVETGETVNLTVRRRSGAEEQIAVQSQEFQTSTVLTEQIGDILYMQITSFDNNTDEAFIEAINQAEDNEGIKGIIFDLRNNGGGQLTTVVNMLDRLLPEGTIVTEVDRDGNEIERLTSDATQLSIPMAVLVNGSTASASELFSCALRDYGKAFLVGSQTYGKGVAQTTITLKDGSAITITTARYNPPSSANYDGVGLTPDYVVELSEEQLSHFYEMSQEEDPQLQEAIRQLQAARGGAQTEQDTSSTADGSDAAA